MAYKSAFSASARRLAPAATTAIAPVVGVASAAVAAGVGVVDERLTSKLKHAPPRTARQEGRVVHASCCQRRGRRLVAAAPASPRSSSFGASGPSRGPTGGRSRPASWSWPCAAVQAAEIWLFKEVVDEVIVPAISTRCLAGGVVLGLTLVGAPLSFAEDYAWTWAGERFLLDLRGDVLLAPPEAFRSTRSTGVAWAT